MHAGSFVADHIRNTEANNGFHSALRRNMPAEDSASCTPYSEGLKCLRTAVNVPAGVRTHGIPRAAYLSTIHVSTTRPPACHTPPCSWYRSAGTAGPADPEEVVELRIGFDEASS